MGISLVNKPFWGTPIYGKPYIRSLETAHKSFAEHNAGNAWEMCKDQARQSDGEYIMIPLLNNVTYYLHVSLLKVYKTI